MKDSKKFMWTMILAAAGWFISMIAVTHLNWSDDKTISAICMSGLGLFILELMLAVGLCESMIAERDEPKNKYCKKQGYEYWYEDKGYLVCGKIADGKKIERYLIKAEGLPK